ncbi:hypothetical protein ACFL2A_06035 [Thermodesulfobacteriota bacterium]
MFFLHLPANSVAKPEKKPRVEVKELVLDEVVIKKKDETLLYDVKKQLSPKASITSLNREALVDLNDEVKESTSNVKVHYV